MKSILVLLAILWIFPSRVQADGANNFVRLEVVQAYLKKNPYIIAKEIGISETSSIVEPNTN